MFKKRSIKGGPVYGWLAILIIISMLAATLGACQQVTQPPPPQAAPTEPPKPTEAPVSQGQPAQKTIKLVINPAAQPKGGIVEATGKQSVEFTQMFPLFLKRNPGFTLDTEELMGDTEGRTKYLMQCRDKTIADVSQLDGFWVAEFATLGCTRPLDDIMDKDLLADYFDAFKIVYQGKIHGLIPSTAFNSMLWYRTDLFKEAGLSGPPKDWNELKEYAKKLTVKDANGNVTRYGLAFSGAQSELTTVTILGYYWQGEDVFVTDDNQPAFNNQTSVDVFNLFAGMYKDGSVLPDVINMGYNEVQQAFFADKAAMMLHGSWLAAGMDNLAPQLKGKIGLAPNPVYPKTGKRGTNAGGWGFSITTPDDSKLKASADLMWVLNGGDKNMYRDWIVQNGALPTLKSMANDPAFATTDWQKIILSELPYAKTRPAVAIYPDASLEWALAFQETMLGKKTAEQALKDAVDRTIATAKDKGYIK